MIYVIKQAKRFLSFPFVIISSSQLPFSRFSNLGIDDMYFMMESVDTIAQHIMSLYAAKIFAYVKNENVLDVNLEREKDDGAVYIHTSRPGVSQLSGPQHERKYVIYYYTPIF